MAKGIKTGGRKVGSPNVTTKEVKQLLRLAFTQNSERLMQELKELDAKNFVNAMIKISSYLVPKPTTPQVSWSELTSEEEEEVLNRLANKVKELTE